MIKKYRKKPAVIEAIQWTGENFEEICNFVGRALRGENYCTEPIKYTGVIAIPTLEGDHLAIPSDYIIKGIKGEFYPCKEEIFKETYEVVE